MDQVADRKTAVGRRGGWLGLALGVLCLPACGCANFIDDITAQSPEGGIVNDMKFRWALMVHKPAPLDVLANSTDGDLRARAYRQLKEPKQHGGSDEDQQRMLEMLATAAKSERDLICRIAAVEKLGEFKDPRAVQPITDAFYAQADFGNRQAVLRIAAVRSLGQHGDAASAELIAEAVARDPDRDVRIAAAEALGHYQNYQATSALLKVLQEDKDVAMRHQATVSLQKITGKNYPPDASAWEQYLNDPTREPELPVTHTQPKGFLKLVTWWQD